MSSLKFLGTKFFHPGTMRNRKAVWLAEERDKEKAAKLADRQQQLKTEAEQRENKFALATRGASKGERDMVRKQMSLDFMYQAPPGLGDGGQKGHGKPADKDAGATDRDANRGMKDDHRSGDGKKDGEKGKRVNPRDVPMEERFTFLKNAPVQGKWQNAKGVKLNHNPFGVALRNVKCIRCGEWGHTTGDRECPKAHENPNDEWRRGGEDPLTLMNRSNNDPSGDRSRHVGGGAPPPSHQPTHKHLAESNLMLKNHEWKVDDLDILPPDIEGEARYEAQQMLDNLSKKERKKLYRHFKKERKDERRRVREKHAAATHAQVQSALAFLQQQQPQPPQPSHTEGSHRDDRHSAHGSSRSQDRDRGRSSSGHHRRGSEGSKRKRSSRSHRDGEDRSSSSGGRDGSRDDGSRERKSRRRHHDDSRSSHRSRRRRERTR